MGVQILKVINLASLHFFLFPRLLRRLLQKWVAASLVYPSVTGASWRGALNSLSGYLKIFSHGLCIFYSSPPRLAASVVVVTILLIALAYSLQLLAYMYFRVVAMLHLLEASTSYHVLSHKVIS